ncbi:MAG TPA: hypothetical protein VFP95_01575 [Gammaproteobacteria bacterium]|nr:hypothetical protein [Gammaproteobacteria bacterium]
MKNIIVILGISALMLLSGSAQARDTEHLLSIETALAQPAAKEKLTADIKYYFGDEAHPAVAKSFGVFATNKKTNAFGKSDEEACRWVFLSAMLQLQERAVELGADAVINIKSNYKDQEFVSSSEYECGAGFLMAGVALKGEFVKLK